jgi:hypothetical protein
MNLTLTTYLGDKATTIFLSEGWGAGIFIVLVKKISELQSKYIFLMRRKAKKIFPIMWNRNIFFFSATIQIYFFSVS